MMTNIMGALEAALVRLRLEDPVEEEPELCLGISRTLLPALDGVRSEVKPTQIHLQGFAELPATEADQLPPSAKLVQVEVLKILDKAQ